jgi:hypothetical protein
MVVLLDSARSAEPPQSSGTFSAIALITCPLALRVATPLGSAAKVGRSSAQPCGRLRVCIRSKSAFCSGWSAAHASKASCHSAWARWPRSTSLRVCSSTPGGISKVWSASKPSTFLVAATSSSPRADPCALPVFWASGAGQAMIVRRTMKLGRSVTARAASMAASSAGTSSAYSVSSWVQSTVCTCQP